MNIPLTTYRRSREDLLTDIAAKLSGDDRFLAAWLTGSYARNDADDVSDLDLTVVVDDPYSDVLCARQEQVSHATTEERLALFRLFGQPALIHENNNNAPGNGTFTFVLYSGSALMVDWVLIPRKSAQRPGQSVLLFEKYEIPAAPAPQAEPADASRKAVQEMHAFFWMMASVTAKYLVRGDLVFVQNQLEQLHGLIREIERRIDGLSWEKAYVRGSLSKLQPTRQDQIISLRQLIGRMEALHARLADYTGASLAAPAAEIETLLELAEG